MPREKSRVVQRGYSRIAEKYHNQRHQYQNNALLQRLLRYFQKDSKILDLGCGAGVPVDNFLVAHGHNVTGIDFAEGMLKLAKKNVPKAKFIRMNMTRMKFKPNSFDAVVSFYAIIHVPREKHPKIYRDLHKILKPNGIIFVNATGPNNWEGYSEDYMGVKMFWSHYGPQKTLKIIKNAGFEILWHKVLKLGEEKQFWVLAKNKK